jgi:hypothetical protein
MTSQVIGCPLPHTGGTRGVFTAANLTLARASPKHTTSLERLQSGPPADPWRPLFHALGDLNGEFVRLIRQYELLLARLKLWRFGVEP